MEQCQIDCDLRQRVIRYCRISCISVAASVVKNWFSNSIKEQANTNAASKQHHEPGDVVIFRFVTVFAELDVGILAEVQHHHEQGTQIL